jgi:outer membrane protease
MKKAFAPLKALLILLVLSAPVEADESHPNPLDQSGWEIGARYWYSTGRNGYNYYGDTTSSLLVSRLIYDGLTAHSGEVYFRSDLPSRVFVKGFVGAGSIGDGTLIDEDFPPVIAPYSKTSSEADGSLNYASIDLGYAFIRQPNVRLGAFAGYGRWYESVDASGCQQEASNPGICVPSVPASIKLINETDTWNLLRIGATGDVMLTERLKLTGDAAYVHAWQRATDNHFYTFGYDPASGGGDGFQLEAILSYQVNDALSLGTGGRWWHLSTSAVDSFDQLLTYDTDRYGVFFQGGYRFN